MVQEGRAPFQGVRHRHPINLHEEILREVRHRVGVLHSSQVVATEAVQRGRPCFIRPSVSEVRYHGYPPKISSPPPPLRATVTCWRVSFDTYQVGRAEESPNGSPKCRVISGRTATASGSTTYSRC